MVERAEEKSEIMAIFHKYKDTLDDLIDSSDIKFLDWLGQNNQGSCNALRSKSSSMSFSKRDYLNKDVFNMPLGLAPKTPVS